METQSLTKYKHYKLHNKMGLFNIFKKTISVNQMMEKATTWTNSFMEQYVKSEVKNRELVKGEVFLFNAWTVWKYCLEHDLLKQSSKTANTFISSAYVYSGADKIMDVTDFYPIFKSRYGMYSDEISGLLNSKYPQTKQYIPFSLFCAIFKNQFKSNVTSGYSMNDIDIMDEVLEFTGNIIKHWNYTLSNILSDVNFKG